MNGFEIAPKIIIEGTNCSVKKVFVRKRPKKKYNQQGRVCYTRANTGVESWMLYDDKGNMTEYKTSLGYVRKYAYSYYDDSDKLRSKAWSDTNGCMFIQTFDTEGRLLASSDTSYSTEEHLEFKYDDKGNVVYQHKNNLDVYDELHWENGNLIKHIYLEKDINVRLEDTYIYNNGTLVQATYSKDTGDANTTSIHSSTFDAVGRTTSIYTGDSKLLLFMYLEAEGHKPVVVESLAIESPEQYSIEYVNSMLEKYRANLTQSEVDAAYRAAALPDSPVKFLPYDEEFTKEICANVSSTKIPKVLIGIDK